MTEPANTAQRKNNVMIIMVGVELCVRVDNTNSKNSKSHGAFINSYACYDSKNYSVQFRCVTICPKTLDRIT